ncbi:hypothetical protein BGZ63DRAFT_377472 [Mariannaea sp. PMI_226]|nr:hypothetical protein BGZ63DRAFT_377472 [Mariannaea sp. PMI_226]
MAPRLRPKPHRQQQDGISSETEHMELPIRYSRPRRPRREMPEPHQRDETGGTHASTSAAAVTSREPILGQITPIEVPKNELIRRAPRAQPLLILPRQNPAGNLAGFEASNPPIPHDNSSYWFPKRPYSCSYLFYILALAVPIYILIRLELLVWGGFPGHPVFLDYLTQNTVEPISLWEPLDHIQKELERCVLPLYLDMRHSINMPEDVQGILETLHDEIQCIEAGMQCIEKPNPNATLARSILPILRSASSEASLYFKSFVRTDRRIVGPSILAALKQEFDRWERESGTPLKYGETERINFTLNTFVTWLKSMQGSYDNGRALLGNVSTRLSMIDKELDTIMHTATSSLDIEPPRSLLEQGINDFFDARESLRYSRMYLIPFINDRVRPMILRAQSTLEDVSNIVAEEIGRYEELQWTKGVEENKELRYGRPPWRVEQITTRTQYVVDAQIYGEMRKLVEAALSMSMTVFQSQIDKDPKKKRPLRPSQKPFEKRGGFFRGL